MKKYTVLFISLTLLVTGFTSCSPNFTPSDDLDYFKIDDVYRVIELSETQNDTTLTMPVAEIGPSFIAATISMTTVTVDFIVDQNATFFKIGENAVNKEGAILVSQLLELDVDKEDFNNYSNINNSVDTYSYNKYEAKIASKISLSIESPAPELNTCVVSYMAEVVNTSFTYYDLSMDTGEQVGSGQFSVYTMVSNPYLDLYYYHV